MKKAARTLLKLFRGFKEIALHVQRLLLAFNVICAL